MSRDPREVIGFEVALLGRLWRTRLDERLAPLGLTQAKWLILVHLSKARGALPQRELSERIGVEGPTVVRVLDGLERLDLIERRPLEGDRRAKAVHLTDLAAPLLEDIIAIAAQVRVEVLQGLSDKEIATCEGAVSAMLGNLGFTTG